MHVKACTCAIGLLLGAFVGSAAQAAAPASSTAGDECFDEGFYLDTYADVSAAVASGRFPTGRAHYDAYGRTEGRLPCAANRASWPIRVILFAAMVAAILALSWRKRFGVIATTVGLALPMAVFAYYDYVVGNRVFIFSDIASDTYTQFWPMMTHLSRRIWRGELPLWSFEIGLGHNAFPGWLSDPFAALAIATGESALPYVLGPLQVLKIVVAALCMAGYFRLLGYGRIACVAGSLSIAFCGHMVSRGTWYEYATEVAVAAFYLYAMERFAQSGRFALLAVATCLIGCPGTYYAYHYFILLTAFALVRIFVFPERLFAAPRAVLGRWVAASTIGVLLVGVFLLPDVLATLRSTRVSGEGEMLSGHLRVPLFTLEQGRVLLTAVARQLSPNLLGSANKYSGYWNYLEAPLAYVGVLPLLCVIPCLVLSGKRQRIVLSTFLVLALAYHLLLYFRLAINAFAGPLFKISSLWIAIGLGLCAAKTLDLIERRRSSPRLALALSLALIFASLGAVRLRAPMVEMTVNRQAFWLCAGVAVACAVILTAIGRRGAELLLHCLVAIAIVDLVTNAYISVNDYRGALDGAEPRVHAGYDDAALRVIRKIRASDASAYRIERDKNSVNLMDALMQDYQGTKAYLSFNSPRHVQFLWDLGLLERTPNAASYITGIGSRSAVLPLVGVKYYLTTSGAAPPHGYVPAFQDGGISVSVNPLAAEGFFYHSAVSREAFAILDGFVEKQAALLHAAILDAPRGIAPLLRPEELRSQAVGSLAGCHHGEECLVPGRIHSALAELGVPPVHLELRGNEVRGSVAAPGPGVLFLAIPFDEGWRLVLDGRARDLQQVNVGFLGAELPAGKHEFILRYRTPGLVPGATLTAMGILLLAAWTLVPRLAQRRGGAAAMAASAARH
jgi:hypothetical protein